MILKNGLGNCREAGYFWGWIRRGFGGVFPDRLLVGTFTPAIPRVFFTGVSIFICINKNCLISSLK